MRILAIDPGYERIGIAIIDKEKSSKELFIYSECFKTKKELPFEERLHAIGEKIEALILEYSPAILAIETLFMETNQKTGMHVSEVRGMLLYIAKTHKMKIHEYTPLQIKVAVTGYGKADKKQVMLMVPKIMTLPKKISSDDELDAIAIGITCVSHQKL